MHVSLQSSLESTPTKVNVNIRANHVTTRGQVRPTYMTSSGYAASDFATGFANNGSYGPLGVAFEYLIEKSGATPL